MSASADSSILLGSPHLRGDERQNRAVRRKRGAFSWHSREALQAVLDHLPVNIFVADLDLTIVYASPAAQDTLRQLREVVMTEFGVDVDEAVGMSMHAFHKDPVSVERVLARPERFPHRASFSFGDLELLGTTSGIRDAAGNLVGYVAVLDNVTDKHRMATQLADTAMELTDSAGGLSTLAEELAATSQRASDRAGTMSAATLQLTDSIGDIASSTSEVTRTTHDVVSTAESASANVTALHESSARIGDITGLITTIAEQTKLLALNATIEATRAGSAGTGFAVVASEVKDLAQRARAATDQISDMIASLQSDIATAGTSLDAIVAGVTRVGERQDEISATLA